MRVYMSVFLVKCNLRKCFMSFYNEIFASSCEVSERKNYNQWDHISEYGICQCGTPKKETFHSLNLRFCFLSVILGCWRRGIILWSLILCFPILNYVCMCLCMYAPYFCATEHTFCKICQNLEIVLVHSYKQFLSMLLYVYYLYFHILAPFQKR